VPSAVPRQELLQCLADQAGDGAAGLAGVFADPRRQRHWQLNGKHRGRLRDRHRPARDGTLDIPAGLPLRQPEPAGQLADRVGQLNAGGQQLSGRVDPRGVLLATSPTTTSHDINILPCMSRTARDTRQTLQPAVTQRHLKAEIAHCVGGVVSPLLLNVALHGMEAAAGVRYLAGTHVGHTAPGSPVVVRHADDLVALCHSREQAEQVKARLADWLAPRGLTFNEDKTRVVHLTQGFDFLGFHVRRYDNGKLIIKPSVAAVKRFRRRLRTEMRNLRGGNAAMVISRLNPILRGWAAYYRTVVSKHVFTTIGSYLWLLTFKWAVRSHRNKPKKWVTARYYGTFNRARHDRWMFGDRDSGAYLTKTAWTPIVRHQMVDGFASPDDPDRSAYWAARGRRRKPRSTDGASSSSNASADDVRSAAGCSCTPTKNHNPLTNGNSGSPWSGRRSAARRSPPTSNPHRRTVPTLHTSCTRPAPARPRGAPNVHDTPTSTHPATPLGLLEPDAGTTRTSGSEWAPARQRAGATRPR
jgi:RNA-directed DNA polymerase